MSTQITPTQTMAFLKEEDATCNTAAALSPLEEASQKGLSFAAYNTGTMELAISPQALAQLESLRHLSVSQDWQNLAVFVTTLQLKLPTDPATGYSIAVINPTTLASLVPYCDTPEDVNDEQLAQATNNIQLATDRYAMVDGVPVWERLDGERVDFYMLFKLYRDSRYAVLNNGEILTDTRSLNKLASRLELPAALVSTLAKIYNWQLRCMYFDSFMELEQQKRKTKEVALLQSDHLKISQQLTNKALEYLDKHPGMLKPKDAIAMLELGLRYSRISLGLPANAPSEITLQRNKTTNIMLTQNNQQADQIVNGSAVENKLQADLKDESNLLSILHVLQASGAMATALNDRKSSVDDTNEDFIDVVDINESDAASEEGFLDE